MFVQAVGVEIGGHQLPARIIEGRIGPGAVVARVIAPGHVLQNDAAWQVFLDVVSDFLPSPTRSPQSVLLERLTSRELDVLGEIARGKSNAEIAQELFISPNTVRNHVNRIFGKLDVSDRAQAIVLARDEGLVADRQ